IVQDYLTDLSAALGRIDLAVSPEVMQSDGTTASASLVSELPCLIIESGPAAGVVAAARLARELEDRQVIAFDMGGTTAKAGLVENGEVMRSEAIEVGGGVMVGSRLLVGAGYMLKLPAIDLAEVGAGGGSICRLDAAGAPKVGPISAGADPGPVCYGRGGVSPTITDCNLVLGYLDPGGLVGGAMKLDLESARAAVQRDLAGPMGCSVEDAAFGMLRLASATMMRAIRAVSVERGRDPRQFALLAFGGNGPLFAAGIARELGIGRVIIPPLSGVFSAFGLLVADAEHHGVRSLRARLDAVDPERIATALQELEAAGAAQLARDGFPPARQEVRRAALARYVGQSSEIEVPLAGAATPADIAEAFGAEHERTYGFRAPASEPVELTGLSVITRGKAERPRLPECIPPFVSVGPQSRLAWFPDGGWTETPVVDRAGLAVGPRVGPLIVQEYDATCLVPHGAMAAVDGFGNIAVSVG
ncbi:MAG: hydantoinase/oxoprolinase family protein, partial [Rhodospirillales bacterium]